MSKKISSSLKKTTAENTEGAEKKPRRSLRSLRLGIPSSGESIFNHQSFWLIGLILVVLIAAFLRFYRLNELPTGLWFDEAWSAVAARETAVQAVFPPYFAASFGGMHPAIVYLTRFANLFSGGQPLTIRYALATVGTLTVLLSFFSYRAIFKLEIGDWRLETKQREQSPISN
ncbi:MAG: hypothetical protein IAF02_28300, partial [Anaerolineae bacterium]|nr:hypothetical protein [Anaerolineae bacterium]